ncbi:MAG: MotA/TolQ/ExbB proton channel family protein [Gammaproteobacteria bacterium]
MYEIVKAGGWLMLPIIASSIVALAIIIERFWTLQKERVAPKYLAAKIWQWSKEGKLDENRILQIRKSSPLGRILAAGLLNKNYEREVMKESIDETGRLVAAVSPLLGLLGTVIGMIQVFSVITSVGVGDPGELAGGISKALITTAAGLSVAIPSLIFVRFFRRRLDTLVVGMEEEAIKLVEVMHGQRKVSS